MALGACRVWLSGFFFGLGLFIAAQNKNPGNKFCATEREVLQYLILDVGTIKVSLPLINCVGFVFCHCIRR